MITVHPLILQRFSFASSTWLNRWWPSLQDHLMWPIGEVFITSIQSLPLINNLRVPRKHDHATQTVDRVPRHQAAHSIDSWSSLQSPSQSWRHRSEHPSVTMMMNIMMSTTLENLFLALNLRNYSTSSLPWLSLQGGTIILILINYIVDKIIYELEVYLYT